MNGILSATGATEYAPEIPSIGSTEIEFISKIGSGCFGDVYKGKCRGQQVALKKISAKKEIEPRFLHDFQMEIAVLTHLRHPSIVQLLGACTEQGNFCIITEFLEYGDLEGILAAKAPISLLQKYSMCHDIGSALAWCHESVPPVIHRDLKPANILISRDFRAKLCDFGLSQFLQTSQLFDTHSAPGTPLWMAPEVLKGGALDSKIDVYAFGIVMWELFTGMEPFSEHESFETFVHAVCTMNERPDLESKKVKSLIPGPFRDVISKTWVAKPEDRPPMSKLLTLLSNAMVACLLPCPIAAAMWKINFGEHQTFAEWKEFQRALFTVLKQDPEQHEEAISCLKELLLSKTFTSDTVVQIEKFGLLLEWFGDLFEEGRLPFLDRIVSLLKHAWFYGETSKDDAERTLLLKGKTGAFLVRFNMREPIASAPFTISKLTSATRKVTEHQRIYYTKGKGFYIVAAASKKDAKDEKLLIPGELQDLISSVPVRKKLNLVVGLELSPLQSLFDGTSSGKYIDDLRSEGEDVSSD